MPAPFQALLPIEGRILLLKYTPMLPFCPSQGGDSGSESESSENEEETSSEVED